MNRIIVNAPTTHKEIMRHTVIVKRNLMSHYGQTIMAGSIATIKRYQGDKFTLLHKCPCCGCSITIAGCESTDFVWVRLGT